MGTLLASPREQSVACGQRQTGSGRYKEPMATATRTEGLHGTIEPDFESVAERVGERSPRS